jgi:uncharacterized protein YdaU (DUF1376 family)
MADFPSMPLFCEPLLADTEHLTDAEMGIYMRMLTRMWLAAGQRFPNNDAWFARKFRRTEDQVRSEIRPLIAEFFQNDGNWITHKRLRKEWEYVERHCRKQSERAKARWDKEKEACHGNATRGNAPTPTPTPTHTKDVPPNGGAPEPPPPPEPAKAALWREMKAQIGGKNPGSLIGKWIRDHGLGAVSDAHYVAMGNIPADYVEWMTARLRANGRPFAERQARAGPKRYGYHERAMEEHFGATNDVDDDEGFKAGFGVPDAPALLCSASDEHDRRSACGAGSHLRVLLG